MTAVVDLVSQLRSNEIEQQIAAAEALAALATDAQPAIVQLVQHCGSSNEDLRNWCTAALEDSGPPTTDQIDELALLASSAHDDVAFWAITLLGRAGSQATSAEGVLQERAADSKSPALQRRAIWALERIQAG